MNNICIMYIFIIPFIEIYLYIFYLGRHTNKFAFPHDVSYGRTAKRVVGPIFLIMLTFLITHVLQNENINSLKLILQT